MEICSRVKLDTTVVFKTTIYYNSYQNVLLVLKLDIFDTVSTMLLLWPKCNIPALSDWDHNK